MKRRSFLGLLGLAPAVPLAAKQLEDLTPPAPKELTPGAVEFVHFSNPEEARSLYWGSSTCSYSIIPTDYRRK